MIETNKSLSFQALLDKIKNTSPILVDNIEDAEIAYIISFIKNHYEKDILIISTDRRKDLLYKNLSLQMI